MIATARKKVFGLMEKKRDPDKGLSASGCYFAEMNLMKKTDLTKELKAYYAAKGEPECSLTGPGEFLSLTGKGDPWGKDCTERIHALYATAFEIRRISREAGSDFVMPKLESLWDFPDASPEGCSLAEMSLRVPRDQWGYCLMFRMPAFVITEQVARAKHLVAEAKGMALALEIELHARLPERVVQLLHEGPFEKEPASLKRMELFMEEKGLLKDGPRHEIHLTRFMRTGPEKLRTILRIPVRKKPSGLGKEAWLPETTGEEVLQPAYSRPHA